MKNNRLFKEKFKTHPFRTNKKGQAGNGSPSGEGRLFQ